MFTKFYRPMKLTAIIGMVFVVVLSIAWANVETSIKTYNGSVIVENGSDNKGIIQLVQQDADYINVEIAAGSLDAYMAEESLYEVEITCLYTQQWVDTNDGDGYYKMRFELGPSGAYFSPEPLILKVLGKWVANDSKFWLYDENGEALEGIRHNNGNQITFEIDHFSCYYYEDYCY